MLMPPVDRAGVGVGGCDVCMTQCTRRGVIFPTSTRIVCVGESVSKYVTASLAAASMRSLP